MWMKWYIKCKGFTNIVFLMNKMRKNIKHDIKRKDQILKSRDTISNSWIITFTIYMRASNLRS